MKICTAQIAPFKGDLKRNIDLHKKWIQAAAKEKADLIIFPELSLTSYEPTMASHLAFTEDDVLLDEFRELARTYRITIGLGFPRKSVSGIEISMAFILHDGKIRTYSKQRIHADEEPFFVSGKEQLILELNGIKLAPAICYEAMFEDHIAKAKALGAEVYLVSVAKHKEGMKAALEHLSIMAAKYGLPVFISNGIGPCDDFICAGKSAIWNRKGEKVSELGDEEGLLIYDLE